MKLNLILARYARRYEGNNYSSEDKSSAEFLKMCNNIHIQIFEIAEDFQRFKTIAKTCGAANFYKMF